MLPQLRKDPVTGRWVIVNTENPQKEFTGLPHTRSTKTCPFCPGNESMTPPEIASFPKKGGKGWQVRVIPNKFPALRIEEKIEKQAIGPYDKVGGFGAHEVIIENPEHDKEIADLPVEQVELILRMYRDRCLDLKKDARLKYILLFKNYGEAAGASLEHPHSQLIAMPIVPSRVLGEVKGSVDHFSRTERCIFCDILHQEETEKKLTVFAQDGFIALAPFASRFPFETWILPRTHEASFDSLGDNGLRSLAETLKTTLGKLKRALHDPSFNFMVHTVPMNGKDSESFHWHIEIIPNLTRVAGFELGTGFYVNPTPPEIAAEILKNA